MDQVASGKLTVGVAGQPGSFDVFNLKRTPAGVRFFWSSAVYYIEVMRDLGHLAEDDRGRTVFFGRELDRCLPCSATNSSTLARGSVSLKSWSYGLIAYLLHCPCEIYPVFKFMRQRPDRASIKLEWIQRVIDHPEREVVRTMVVFAFGPPFQK